MTHPIRYRGNNAAVYEAALLKLFRKHPPSRSEFSITIYERGKLSGRGKLTHQWLASSKSIQAKAKQMAETIVAESKYFSRDDIKGFMFDF
jgi:hypothetical protein